jgi:tetratricopeptide (TPR) repeat protein
MSAPRLEGLDNTAAQQVLAVSQALGLGRVDQAEAQLQPALGTNSGHPEVLRLYAGIRSLRGDHANALDAMQRAIKLRPVDPLYYNTLGTILGASGDYDAAIRALRRACEFDPGLSIGWYNLGVMLTRSVRNEEAADALRRAVELAPDNMDARALLADMLRTQGHIKESASEYRKVLVERPRAGMAWWGLADLRNGSLKPDDIELMRTALRDSRTADQDRIAIGYALAAALDQGGYYEESMNELKRANAIARLRQRWNASGFSAAIDTFNQAFRPPPDVAGDLGREVLFIVGMPRSGTTLVEQILASHSEVEGAGELPDLPLVLAEESRRRSLPFPRWVHLMQRDDWQRLGARYLERTAHWLERRAKFTDKLPNNWMYLGAIRAMLPGAHIVVCRRNALETCFSCYRQHLANNEYTRTPEDLAAFWRDFDRTAEYFLKLHPGHIYQHAHESLVQNPEQSIRRLLDACELPLEEACLRFYESDRDVRSPSATQVRKPVHQMNTSHTQRYGSLLDTFRVALGMPPFEV